MVCSAGMGLQSSRPRHQPRTGMDARKWDYYAHRTKQWKGAEYNSVLELVSPLLPFIRYPLMTQSFLDDNVLPTGLLAAGIKQVSLSLVPNLVISNRRRRRL